MWRSALPARQLNLESGATETAEAVAASGLPCHDVGTGAIEKFRAARRTQAIVKTTDQDGHTRPAAAAVPPDRRSSARDRLSPRRTPVAAVVAGPRPRRSESAAGPPGREDEDQARPRRSDLWPAEGDPRNAPERPAGEPRGPQAYAFGNEIGQKSGSIKTAWRLACRRAQIVDLHFHDLRREAGSRWLEGGVPLQVVRDWLGHTNISQTSTYLESTFMGQHDAMRRFEETRGRAARAAKVRAKQRAKKGFVQRRETKGGKQPNSGSTRARELKKNPNESANGHGQQ
jgi:hypothetical protein